MQRLKRGPVGVRAARKSGPVERAQVEKSVAHPQPDVVIGRLVQAGLRGKEGLSFGEARALARKAVDIVVAIALDMANDDPRSLGSNWTMHEEPIDRRKRIEAVGTTRHRRLSLTTGRS